MCGGQSQVVDDGRSSPLGRIDDPSGETNVVGGMEGGRGTTHDLVDLVDRHPERFDRVLDGLQAAVGRSGFRSRFSGTGRRDIHGSTFPGWA